MTMDDRGVPDPTDPTGYRTVPVPTRRMGDRSVPDLTKQTVNDLKRLVQLEVQLAVEGMKDNLRLKATGAGAGLGGAVVALYGLQLALVAAALGLALVLPMWAAFLIVGGALFLIAGALAAFAAARMKTKPSPTPQESVDQAKEDVRWVLEKSS
jgi:Putative Actinobacterial Holin-X, holin superfamily III